MDNNIINIDIERLKPHPQNPRKQIGDVSELAESIKKNGILINRMNRTSHSIRFITS